jgi:hypothetical protein
MDARVHWRGEYCGMLRLLNLLCVLWGSGRMGEQAF